MLNKDQYNQEEYDDYYKQAVEGAEIKGSKKEPNSKSKSKIIVILLLFASTIAGYFAYTTLNNAKKEDAAIDESLKVSMEPLPQSEQKIEKNLELTTDKDFKKEELSKVTEAKQVSSEQSTINAQVTKAIETETTEKKGKMSPEEIATIVAAVMQKINKTKELESVSSLSETSKEESQFINELSDSEVDSVSKELIKELENININENKKIDNSKTQMNVYNKVNTEDSQGTDALTKLSDQINAVMEEEISTNKVTNYTNSLKSEVDVRKNEMRIIVVQKGDTLGKISQRAYGNVMDYKKIYQANPEVTRPDRIYIGQKLRIPN